MLWFKVVRQIYFSYETNISLLWNTWNQPGSSKKSNIHRSIKTIALKFELENDELIKINNSNDSFISIRALIVSLVFFRSIAKRKWLELTLKIFDSDFFSTKTGSENKPTTSTNLYFGTRRFGTIQLTFANYLAQYENNIKK